MASAVVIGGVRISSPDDVLYPEQGITKRALAEYLDAVAPHLLTALRGRPVTLVRCPDGQGEACFYQRHAAERGAFAALRRVALAGPGEAREDYLVVGGRRALLALAQMRVLEIHVWNARVDRIERPDRLVLDLDPGPGVGWESITDTAFYFRERLAALGLASFVKTTGGKGLHVVAPLARRATHQRVRAVARALAEAAAREAPDRLLAHATKADRTGRIYVDYLRNGWGASAVAAYSPRARPGAPVSTPLAWEELRGGARPEDFDIRTVPARLASGADPWADYPAVAGQRITRAAERALGVE